jgi:Transposase domain (DUF772)
MAMVVQCPDDLVGAMHPVRMVAAVVAKLDLSRFGEPIQAREGVAGRDATDPELLVALWLYGCIRGIGSARELARRCEESAGFRWLCGGVSVNHRWLSDFRTDHGEGLDQPAICGSQTSSGDRRRGWNCSCHRNRRERPRTEAGNWKPSPETAKRCGRGSSAWRVQRAKRFIAKERRPVKPSTPTCAVIAGSRRSRYAG